MIAGVLLGSLTTCLPFHTHKHALQGDANGPPSILASHRPFLFVDEVLPSLGAGHWTPKGLVMLTIFWV